MADSATWMAAACGLVPRRKLAAGAVGLGVLRRRPRTGPPASAGGLASTGGRSVRAASRRAPPPSPSPQTQPRLSTATKVVIVVAALVVAALVATLVVLVVREPPRTPLDPPPSVPSSAGVPSERTATPIEAVFIDLGYQCVLELDDMADVFGCYLRTTSSGDLTFRWLVDASDTVIAYQFYGTSADFDEHAAVAIREATDETSSAVLETKQELAADSTRPVETDWGTHQVRRFGEDRYDLQGTRQGRAASRALRPTVCCRTD